MPVTATLEHFTVPAQVIVDAAPSGMMLVNQEGSIVMANQLLAQQFRYSHEELLGQSMEMLIPERFRSNHPAKRMAFFAAPEPRPMGRGRDLYGQRKDGTEFPVEIGLNPLTMEEGSFVLASVVDITERKQTELVLIERNRMLALDAEVGRVINWSQDIQSLLQGCTEALVRNLDAAFARIWTLNATDKMLELQASAGLYTHLNGPHGRVPVGQFKIGKIASERQPHLTNAVVGDPRVPEQEWAKREGLVAFAGYPLMRGKEVLGVMAMFSNHPLMEYTLTSLKTVSDRITTAIERLAAEKAHQRLAELNKRILASAGEGIYGLDLDGKCTFVNPAAVNMLGYGPEELIGHPMHATMHHTKADGTQYPCEEGPMYIAFKEGTIHHGEDEVLWRKDGTSFHVAYRSTPIRDENNITIGAVVTFSDITDRKKAEQSLLDWNQALETSNRELDDFAYIISHDLKEPLRGIYNYSTILLEDHAQDLNDDGRVRCETLCRLSRRMEELLDALLYYSRTGRTDLALQVTDLDEVLDGILETLDLSLKEHGVFLKVSQTFPKVYCDAVRVGEIFRNLITNAMKYNDKEEKWIEVGYHNGLKGGLSASGPSTDPVVFYVKDNGIGIKEKYYQDIFRIFKRLHDRDKFGGGTGMGLTLTKKLVERHGGQLWVESTIGEGTTFFFTLHRN